MSLTCQEFNSYLMEMREQHDFALSFGPLGQVLRGQTFLHLFLDAHSVGLNVVGHPLTPPAR